MKLALVQKITSFVPILKFVQKSPIYIFVMNSILSLVQKTGINLVPPPHPPTPPPLKSPVEEIGFT